MKKITGYDKFFAVLDKMDSDMDEFANEQKERFWASRIDHETTKSNCKPYSKNKLLWQGFVEVNGGSKGRSGYDAPCVFMWRTTKAYMTGKTEAQIFAESETKKVLHSEKGYDFCLIRDYLRPNTETYWGKKFIYEIDGKDYHHKMVIMKGEKKVFECFERWELANFCDGIRYEVKEPETPSEIFRSFNPFKVIVKPFTMTESIEELSTKLEFHINRPTEIWKEIQGKLGNDVDDVKDKWLICLMGMQKYGERWDNHNATWFIMTSRTKPTTDEALIYMMEKLDFYDEENIVDLLQKMKNEYAYDLNEVNIPAQERLRDLWERKVKYKLQEVLNCKYKDLKKLWETNLVYS